MAPQQPSTPPREHTNRTGLRSALWLPVFDGLADPAVVTRLAAEAEEAGWHGSSSGTTCAGGPQSGK